MIRFVLIQIQFGPVNVRFYRIECFVDYCTYLWINKSFIALEIKHIILFWAIKKITHVLFLSTDGKEKFFFYNFGKQDIFHAWYFIGNLNDRAETVWYGTMHLVYWWLALQFFVNEHSFDVERHEWYTVEEKNKTHRSTFDK